MSEPVDITDNISETSLEDLNVLDEDSDGAFEETEELFTEFDLDLIKYKEGADKYKSELERLFAKSEITRDSYYTELISLEQFNLEYFKQQNEIALTQEGEELLKNIYLNREQLKQNVGTMSIEEYNNKLLENIKEEQNVFKDFNFTIKGKPQLNKLENMSLIEKLDELTKMEDNLITQTAKRVNLKLNKPRETDRKSSDIAKNQKYAEDLIVFNKQKNFIRDNYLAGYLLEQLDPTKLAQPNWTIQPPTVTNLKELKNIDKPKDESIYNTQLNTSNVIQQDPDKLKQNINFIVRLQNNKIPTINKLTKNKDLTIDYIKEQTKEYNFDNLKDIYTNNSLTKLSNIKTINQNEHELTINNFDYTIISNTEFYPLILTNLNKTKQLADITYVYILSQNRSKTVFTDFKEYLVALLEVLENNLIILTENTTINNIKFKIQQIETYLNSEEYLTPEKIKSKVNVSKVREEGLIRLTNLFSETKSGVLDNTRDLEKNIYLISVSYQVFNEKLYNFFLDKIDFIIIQYPEVVSDYLNGKLTHIDLINFEVPKNFPDDFTFKPSFKELSNIDKLEQLIKWKPPVEFLPVFKDKINLSNIKYPTTTNVKELLMEQQIEVDDLVAKKIIQEFNEITKWNEYLSQFQDLKVPEGKNEVIWKFKKLNSFRNTLPSMRIYQVATIRERIETQKLILNSVQGCNILFPQKISFVIEKLIFEKTKTDREYKSSVTKVINNHVNLCNLLKSYSTETEEEQYVSDSIILITEYLLNNQTIDTVKLNKIKEAIVSRDVDALVVQLTEEEVELYRKVAIELDEKYKTGIYLMQFISKLYSRVAKNRINSNIKEQNTYIKPYVSNLKPDITTLYHYVNGKYITGGFYPGYLNPSGNPNYSRSELFELAGYYDININEDSYDDKEIYQQIISVINSLEYKKDVRLHQPTPDFSKPFFNLNKLKKMFMFRQEQGFKSPGRGYTVFKDPEGRTYGVPSDYNKGIPVYSFRLKELTDTKVITIEGPAMFENIDITDVSEYYINVEYRDHRGVKVFFKEGVNKNKVKYSTSSNIETCKFYDNEIDCNDVNSYSLAGDKCEWMNNICGPKKVDYRLAEKDIWDWDTDDQHIKFKWNHGVRLIRIFLKDHIESNNMNLTQIKELFAQYAVELTDFKNRLIQESKVASLNKAVDTPDVNYLQVMTKKQLEEAKKQEDQKVDLSTVNKLAEDFKDILKPRNVVVSKPIIPDGYSTINIPVFEIETEEFTTEQLKKMKNIRLDLFGSEEAYEIVEVLDDKIKVKRNGRIFIVKIQNIKTEPTIKKKSTMCLISDEDLKYLKSPPTGFYWFNKTAIFNYEGNNVSFEFETNKVNFIPEQKIVPTGKIQTKDDKGSPLEFSLINRDDILNAMYSTAFSLWLETDGLLKYEKLINADKQVIKFSIERNIKLDELESEKGSSSGISLDEVVAYYESQQPKLITPMELLTSKLDKAIKYKNVKLMESVRKESKKAGLEDIELMAQEALSDLEKTKIEDEKIDKIIKEKKDKLVEEKKSETDKKDESVIKHHRRNIGGGGSRRARNM